MQIAELFLIVLLEVEAIVVLVSLHKLLKSKKKVAIEKKTVTDTLMTKKIEDDLVIEKDRDLVLIDSYIEFIRKFIDDYNQSRPKKLTYRQRQTLNHETFKVLPTVSKYVDLDFYYDLDDKEFTSLTDKELMLMLESSYNDYTHDNLDSLNTIVNVSLRLRDDVK